MASKSDERNRPPPEDAAEKRNPEELPPDATEGTEPVPQRPENTVIDEASDESFPASDPPAWTPSTI